MTDAGQRLGVSVILIVKNGERRLRQCLESVAWAREIIVVDSASTDNTVAIAREFTDKIFQKEWTGFGAQKNFALDKAAEEWVLSIDADECVPPELMREIAEAIARAGDTAGYEIPRRSSYCGRFMRHSGWWPDPVARLVRRGRGRFTDDPVHERLVIEAPVGRLSSPLVHYPYDDFEQVLDKLNRYSTTAAQAMFEQGRRAGLFTAISHGCWSFLRTYFFGLGILDGKQGFMLAVTNAEHSYYRYLKLWRMSQTKGSR